MAAWQFDGTVCYQSGKRVPYAGVAFGIGNASRPATVYRTDTDLAGRYQCVWRDAPAADSGAAVWVRVFDSWRRKWSDWSPASDRDGNVITTHIVLPWPEAEICYLNGQWHAAAEPFVDGLVALLDRRKPLSQAIAVRLQPVTETGEVSLAYPLDPAMDRMFLQFLEEFSQARSERASLDMARRVSDCLMRLGLSNRFDERVDVFRFALHSLHARPNEDRKTHVRSLLKALSISGRRPFVPGNGAVLDLESSTAVMAVVLYACAHLSLGRTDLRLAKEMAGAARTQFVITVP